VVVVVVSVALTLCIALHVAPWVIGAVGAAMLLGSGGWFVVNRRKKLRF
jgi:LPXTG-motif cell wall-anchored protein